MDDVIYDENVNYDALEKYTYEDSGDAAFYTCPVCGGMNTWQHSSPSRMGKRCASTVGTSAAQADAEGQTAERNVRHSKRKVRK